MANIPTKCQGLANQLQQAKELLAGLEDDFKTEKNPQERSRIFFLIRSARSKVAQLTQQLSICITPPPLRPDLTPMEVTIHRHADGKAFDAALVIHNLGTGPAKGPFKVTLGVSYNSYSHGQPLMIYRELNISVPASVTIAPDAVYTTASWPNITLERGPGHTMAPYTFYALVDADNQVAEQRENNNNFQITKLL